MVKVESYLKYGLMVKVESYLKYGLIQDSTFTVGIPTVKVESCIKLG